MVDIDVNYLSEAINDKMDRDGHNAQSPSAVMIDSYVNGTSGYRVWSDGYCEQWGRNATNGGVLTISFVKTFANIPVVSCVCDVDTDTGTYRHDEIAYHITTTSFQTFWGNTYNFKIWKACGYLAEGEYSV